jgi:UDP-N-acetylmuramoyl-L-alanyl-D-glutamate--2,6-diaminopimelate ligase
MTLGELLADAKLRRPLPSEIAIVNVSGLEYDSRRVRKDFVFFAFAGAHVDGRRFAQDALEKGACAVVSELARPEGFSGVWIEAEHGRHALASAARKFYAQPDERIHFTGITGTNGKTTTSYLIESILQAAGNVTGLIGTIQYRLAGETRPAPNTTPESLDVMRFAAELESRGGTHLISEISSHALALGRIYGFRFHTAVFTNLTRDHLDFHGTMEEYAAAKRLLFLPQEGPAPQWAVLNHDDPWTASFAVLPQTQVLPFGLSRGAALRAENIRSGFDGLHFDLVYQGARQPVESAMAGRINVLNILAAAGTGLSYGMDLPTVANGIASCRVVPGRFERIDCGQPFLVVVDYAHTPDALRNTIAIARDLTKGRVITLFGCGGDRDRSKRPLMGMAAAELSDFVVLTSDNPRSEDPLAIMNDALVGVRRFDTQHAVEPDRAKAIRIAIEQAGPDDVVLLAGKGHETYQVFKDRTVPFDDREAARQALKAFFRRKES